MTGGGGICTPIGDTKKGKESENLKTVLVFQVLLAGIVAFSIDGYKMRAIFVYFHVGQKATVLNCLLGLTLKCSFLP